MKDEKKTKKQLINELIELRQRIAELEALETQRKRAEEALREAKEKYRSIVETAPDGIVTVNLKGIITSCNSALTTISGFSKSEIVGKPFSKLPTLRARDVPRYMKMFNSLIRGKVPRPFEIRWLHKDRTAYWAEVRVSLMKRDGKIIGLQAIARDITERKRAEEEMRRRSEELAVLNTIAATVSGSLDLKEVLHQALDKVLEITGFEAGGFGLVDEAREVIVPMAHRGVPQDFLATFAQPRATDGLRWQTVKSGEAIFFENLPHDPRVRGREALIKGFRSGAYLPLKVKDKSMGLMALGTGHDHHFSPEEKSLLMTIASQIAIAIENAQAYQRLKTQNLETISALAAAVEAKDPYTSGHSEKVTHFAIAIAERMGLSDDEIEDLRVAGLLHDIGKIGLPDSVLNKPAPLTSAEFLMVKTHPVIAAEIVRRIEALAHLVPIIRHHHERWDGTGYPDGLKGDDIPLPARILAVADGFEAMTSERPYRRARTEEEALAELERGAGSQWAPKVVEVFVKIYEEGALKHQAGGQ